MSDLVKIQSINRIINDLQSLSSSDFENVGHNVVCLLENKVFRHSGVNKDNQPVKGSVDTISQDGIVVAEYSIDKEYFKSSKKPLHDLNHAFKTQKQCKKLYLISNQEMPPSYCNKIEESEDFKQYIRKADILFYGVKELAEEIYKKSEDLTVRDLFCYYLTSYSNYVEQYECFGRVPQQDSDYITNPEIQEALKNHFKTNNICILNGVSGSGKTQSSIEFAKKSDREVIWLNGPDFENAQTLSSVKAGRNGNAFNIAGAFNTGNKLLIIDDLKRKVSGSSFEELQAGLDRGSCILCTSQIHNDDDIYLTIPSFSKNLISKILKEEPDFVCSEENQEIYEICKNSPIALKYISNTYNSVPKFQARNDFYKDILSDVDSITNDKCESLIQKIIEKITDESTRKLLSFICSIDIDGFNTEILYKLLKIKMKNLEDLSILFPERAYNVLHIHDFVRKALHECGDCSNINYLNFMTSVVKELNGKMTTSILHQAYLSRPLFKSYLKPEINKDLIWLYYLMLQINGDEREFTALLFKDKQITEQTIFPELLCIIDSNETFLLSETKEESDKAKVYQNWIRALENVLKIFHSNNEYLAEIYHHLGKAYRRSRRYSDAKSCFDKVLAIRPNSYETWNQIINLGCSRNAPDNLQKIGKEYYEKLLLQVKQTPSSVTLRIKLALVTFSNYRQYKNIAQKAENIEIFSNIIRQSYLQGFEQIYESFVSFVRLYGYNHPLETKKLFESISSIILIDANYKNIEKFSDFLDAFSSVYELIDEHQKKEEIKAVLLSVVNSSLHEKINSFEKRAILKTYCSVNEAKMAIKYFEKNCNKNEQYCKDDFYLLYYYAKALYMENKYEESLDICKNIENLNSSFNLNNTYELEAYCYKDLKRLDKARDYINKAINLTENGKYKDSLINVLNEKIK